MQLSSIHVRTFRAGSKTYFTSSLFFPPSVRSEVFVLYAFVRTADNFVDSVPQDPDGFYRYRAEYDRALERGGSSQPVIDSFVRLSALRSFDPAWADAFFHSMALDLTKKIYPTIEETLEYVYGSAEVIGLYMAKILRLPDTSFEAAKLLGRSMQYINFIRDIAEDNALGRTYLPLSGYALADLREDTAREKPGEFRRFISNQISLYETWQRRAESGFPTIPYRTRVPIQTASRMYDWTARQIERDPFVVYRRKVKPARGRIVLAALTGALAPWRIHG